MDASVHSVQPSDEGHEGRDDEGDASSATVSPVEEVFKCESERLPFFFGFFFPLQRATSSVLIPRLNSDPGGGRVCFVGR